MTDLLLAGLVLIAMAAIAVMDARRMIVDPRLVLLLVGTGLLWRLFGSATTGSLWSAGLGAALGIGVVAAPIALAQMRRRPWPLFPGDAMMLGGFGFVLGPLGLGWSLLAGSVCALLHRIWLQRRRGRSFRRGYCPLGPGMVAGAMMVFLFVNVGGSLAADRGTPWSRGTPWYGVAEPLPPTRPALHGMDAPVPAPARPGAMETAIGTAALAVTEMAPVRVPLPPSLAAREIAVDEAGPLPFTAMTERIATLAGVPVEVEERPARVAGGAATLPPPPHVSLAFEGRLPGLLNRVAAYTGYDWRWRDGAIVFYRYWDVDQRSPVSTAATAAAADERKSGDEAEVAAAPYQGVPLWIVDRARHPTLRDVLEDWGARAGWSVVWKPKRSYSVGADASFSGGFLDAVDLLLASPATRRSLVALAHEPNRYLVIEDRGSPWYAGAVR